jgi:serine/threonine-protein kinase RsbW
MERTKAALFAGLDSSIPLVRRFVRSHLATHPCLEDAVLIADEFAVNAVRHSGARAFTVELHVAGDRVRVVVRSEAINDSVPHVEDRIADDESETGRGLLIVDFLAKEWGFTPGDRMTVWADLGLVYTP